jgi:hypothetical protein
MKDRFGVTPKFVLNINWEPTLSDSEARLLGNLQYTCRLSKGASTESNTTIANRVCKSAPESVNRLLKCLKDDNWIIRISDPKEVTQRRIVLTKQTIMLITEEFKDWYIWRCQNTKFPFLTEEDLKTRIGIEHQEASLSLYYKNGWIKDEDPT